MDELLALAEGLPRRPLDAGDVLITGGTTVDVLHVLLQAMTTYLVDIKQQYAAHEGGLGMVDPDPEY